MILVLIGILTPLLMLCINRSLLSSGICYYYLIETSKGQTEMKTTLTHKTQFGLVRDVKQEDGKFYAWNETRNQWYRIAKTKVIRA